VFVIVLVWRQYRAYVTDTPNAWEIFNFSERQIRNILMISAPLSIALYIGRCLV